MERNEVVGQDGLHGMLLRDDDLTDGQQRIMLDDGRVIVVADALLTAQSDGSYRLALAASDLDTNTSASVQRDKENTAHTNETVTLPVVAETLEVGKQTVPGDTVRVRKVVRQHEEIVDEPLISERVEVEHVPINRLVEGEVSIRHEGDTMIIPLVEEVLVVEKRLMLREEVRVTWRKVEEHRPQRVTLRHEEAIVDREHRADQNETHRELPDDSSETPGLARIGG